MKYYKYCDLCDKYKKNIFRRGEGYLVTGYRNGNEITKICPRCSGLGYIFVREEKIFEDDNLEA